MASKKNASDDAASESKAKRDKKFMSLRQKVEFLDKLASGQSASSVGRLYGINESTVCYNKKKRKKSIRDSVAASAQVSFLSCDLQMEKKEKV